MTVKTAAVTVQSNAVTALMDPVGSAPESVAVYNNGSVTVYMGGSDVSSTNAPPVPAGTWSAGFELQVGEVLYGRAASATADCRVVRTGAP